MDYMRMGIGFQGYAQKNPKHEYKRQSFELFQKMLDNLKLQVVSILCRIQIQVKTPEQMEAEKKAQAPALSEEEAKLKEDAKKYVEMGTARNDPCPCGSSKKFKACHGKYI